MRILVVSRLDPDALATLERRHDVVCRVDPPQEQLEALVADREILVFRSGVQVTPAVLDAAPGLGLLVRAGAGLDNVDPEDVRSRGIDLVNVRGPGSRAVAEMAFALLLSLVRNLQRADRLTRDGAWAKHELTGQSLAGRVLGIVGCGNIGSLVGRMGVAWGMEVVGCVEHPNPHLAADLATKGIRLAALEEVLTGADYVTVHVPLQASTRHLLDADALALMKPGAYLVNLARGGVVDEHALRDALTTGHLAGAALDVHEEEGPGAVSPLADLPDVLLTPHIGAGTIDAQREIGRRVVELVEAFAAARSAVA